MQKKDIVRQKKIFNEILQSKQQWKSKYFVIYMKENELEHSCFGIAVGKKIGNAVVRNRLKRVYRSIIDENKIKFPKPYNYIIIVRNESLGASYQDINKEVQIFLDKRV